MFHGKPIIAYSIEAALESGLFDSVFVSTDDNEIHDIALTFGATDVYVRPDSLCLDSIGTLEVAADVARFSDIDFDYACCIYATAPMLKAADLVRGAVFLKVDEAMHCVSVGVEPLRDAAQFYWSTRDALTCEFPYYKSRTSIVTIDESRICDINTPEDWQRAEQMYAKLHGLNHE